MPISTANNKRVAKNTLFLYSRMIIVMAITLYTTRALLTVLGVEDYGVYNVVCGFVSMFSFLNTSMANGTQRFYNFEIGKNGESGISKIFSHAVIIQLAMALVILFVVETIGLWYLYNKMVIPDDRFGAAMWIFQFSMIQLFLVMITVPYNAAVMAYEKMDFFALVSIIDAVLKLVIVLLLPYAPFDTLVYYGALMTLVSVLNYVLNLGYSKLKLKSLVFCTKWDKSLFISMLSFSGWNIYGSISHMMQSQGINLILNAFWGTIVNTANGVATQVNSAVNSLTTSFVTAVRPQMIKSYASGNILYLKKMYYSVSKLTFFLVMILAVPLIGEIDVILDVWLGNGKYPEMTDIFCQLTIFMALCNSYATPTSIIIHATGNMKKFQIIVSSVTLMIVPLAYIAAKMRCEASLIIFLSALVTIAAQIARLVIIKEQVGFPIIDYCKKVFLPTWSVLLVTMIVAFVLRSTTPQLFMWSIVRMGVCVLFSSLCIYLMGINKSEKQLVMSFIKKSKHSI